MLYDRRQALGIYRQPFVSIELEIWQCAECTELQSTGTEKKEYNSNNNNNNERDKHKRIYGKSLFISIDEQQIEYCDKRSVNETVTAWAVNKCMRSIVLAIQYTGRTVWKVAFRKSLYVTNGM